MSTEKMHPQTKAKVIRLVIQNITTGETIPCSGLYSDLDCSNPESRDDTDCGLCSAVHLVNASREGVKVGLVGKGLLKKV